jgi:hypothetical protein
MRIATKSKRFNPMRTVFVPNKLAESRYPYADVGPL